MDGITDLVITVDGVERDETKQVTFENISDYFDLGTARETLASVDNSITVVFNKPVDFNVLHVNGTDLPDEITILVRGIDENGVEHKSIVNLSGNEFVVDGMPAVKKVVIIFVYSSDSKFTLGTQFLGCLHAGMI